MSGSIRVSPQASKVLSMETRSTGSDATVIHLRLKKSGHARKQSFYTAYNSKVQSVSNYKRITSGCAELETEGNAVVVQCKHTLKECAYNWHSTVLPLRYDAADEPYVINIIHDTGGAKAPWLICEGNAGGP